MENGFLSFSGDQLFLVAFLLGIVAVLVFLKLRRLSPLECNLFGELVEIERCVDEHSFLEVRQISNCGKQAVGVLRNGFGQTKYFCNYHDPKAPWMQSWLDKHGIKTDEDTITYFCRMPKDP